MSAHEIPWKLAMPFSVARVQPGSDLDNMLLAAATRRRAIEDMIERLIVLLDAMDGDPDLEPDQDQEAEPNEAGLQPLTLARDTRPAVVLTPARRAA